MVDRFAFIVITFATACLALAKGALIHPVRPRPVTFRACVFLELLATSIAIIAALYLPRTAEYRRAHETLARPLCTVIIAGNDLIASIALFSALALLSSLVILSIAWRRHLLRAWLAALLANGAMCLILSITVILLISPAPFLVPLQSPRKQFGRDYVCYPPMPGDPRWGILP